MAINVPSLQRCSCAPIWERAHRDLLLFYFSVWWSIWTHQEPHLTSFNSKLHKTLFGRDAMYIATRTTRQEKVTFLSSLSLWGSWWYHSRTILSNVDVVTNRKISNQFSHWPYAIYFSLCNRYYAQAEYPNGLKKKDIEEFVDGFPKYSSRIGGWNYEPDLSS